MNKILEIKVVSDYCIWIKFNDGSVKVVDFKDIIGQGLSKELLNKDYFMKVAIESGGGLEWPNGFDVCPNFLKDYVSNAQSDKLKMA
ncbi:MAG: DUF2442 domain-containing protein [Bacteroidota bacterium]